MRNYFPPILEEAQKGLEVELSIADKSRALKGMGSLKAPGQDGYQPLFIKRIWILTSNSL